MLVDLMTSPPSSAAPSPSLALLATIPALIPTYPSPLVIHSLGARRASTFSAPESDNTEPSQNTRASCSEADTAVREASTLGHGVSPALAARQARASYPQAGVGLNETGMRKTSLKIQLPPVPSYPNDRPVPSYPYDAQANVPPALPPKPSHPRLSFSINIDENAGRKSSYCRTPYPLSPKGEEGADYLSGAIVAGDLRRMHPCDRAEEEISWADPWSRSQLKGGEGEQQDALLASGGAASVQANNRVAVVDIEQWASAGMEHASSVDSQTAVEGDGLLLG